MTLRLIGLFLLAVPAVASAVQEPLPVATPSARMQVDPLVNLRAQQGGEAPLAGSEERRHEFQGAGTSNAMNDSAGTTSGPGGYNSGGRLTSDPTSD